MRAHIRYIQEKSGRQLRVVTYNVSGSNLKVYTADSYNRNYLWSRRFPLMMEELVAYKPDVLFLLDVNITQFYQYWREALSAEPLNLEVAFRGHDYDDSIKLIGFNREKMESVTYEVRPLRDYSLAPSRFWCFGDFLCCDLKDTRKRLLLGSARINVSDLVTETQSALVLHDAVSDLKRHCGAHGIILSVELFSELDSPTCEVLEYQSLTPGARDALHLDAERVIKRERQIFRDGDHDIPLSLAAERQIADLCKFMESKDLVELSSCYSKLMPPESTFPEQSGNYHRLQFHIFVSNSIVPRAVLHLPLDTNTTPSRRRKYPSDHFAIGANVDPGSGPAD